MAISTLLIGWQTFVLDLLFPRRCVDCGEIGAWICGSCEKKVVEGSLSEVMPGKELSAIVSFLDFGKKPVRELIHFLKYNGIYEAAAVLMGLASKVVSREEAAGYFGKDVLLVPVPTSDAKRKIRGYNQAEELANRMGEWLGLPVANDVLLSTKKKQSQVGKGIAERSQLEGRFALREGADAYKDRKLVLVDDVFTTGSTLEACARVLKEAGLMVVGAMVMSHKRGN